MPEAPAGVPHETDAAKVLAAAERVLHELESAPDTPERNRLLLQASFLARLASALLLEPEFPALPEGFERLLDRDRARLAARQLARSRGRQYRSFSRKGGDPTPRDRQRGTPVMEIDHRLAARTAATIRELEDARIDLFSAYLHLWDDASTTPDPEAETASLALLDRYWRSQRRLLQIAVERPPKGPLRRSRKDSMSGLHPPHWKHYITWELWRSLDQQYLFWTDPIPRADPSVPSQEL